MIRFIDLGRQIFALYTPEEEAECADLDLPRSFAFFDTITNLFLEIDGEQTWTSWEDFESALQGAYGDAFKALPKHRPLWERCRCLCDEWVFSKEVPK